MKSHSLFLSLALAGALRAQGSSAQGGPNPNLPLESTLQSLEAARAGVRTLEADFTQERVMGLFSQTLRSRGRLVVQRPDRLRWEVLDPSPAVFVVADGRVGFRTAGGGGASATQAQAGALTAVLADLGAMLGGSLTGLQRRYTLSARAHAGGGTELLAVPTDATVARSLARVRLVFSTDLRSIVEVELEEPGGDRSTVRLANPTVNSGHVDARSFALPAPATR